MIEENKNLYPKERKNNFFVPFIITLLLVIGLIAYLGYEKIEINYKDTESKNNEVTNQTEPTENTNTSTDNNESNQNQNITSCPSLPAPKCVGTYSAQDSYGRNYTYTLNTDSTYTYQYQTLLREGTFVINGNTISLISHKDTTGPSDMDPAYDTTDLVIGEDCSFIFDVLNNIRLNKIS